MKTIFHAQIISNLLVISAASFLTADSQSTTTTTLNVTHEPAAAVLVADYQNQNATTTTTNHSATNQQQQPRSSLPPLRGRNLIGSILLRAANLNALNQEHYATNEQDELELDLVDDQQQQQPPSSQLLVPTDSGEDPLETTMTTITSDEQHRQTTTDDDDELDHSTGQQQAPPTSISSSSGEPDLVVDSNNVSAIIMSSSSTNNHNLQPSQPLQHQTGATIKHTQRAPMSCEQAYTQCALRKACAPALQAYNDHCHELISNQTNECSPKCLDTMIALRSSEEGDDLANCDCQSNEYCLASKQRSQLCKEQVNRAIDPKTVVSCSTATGICMSDQSCAPALGFYYRNCRSLLTQRHCSARCNNSLAVLHRQPKAAKLMSCQCDGSEDFPCARLKAYTEQLCLSKQSIGGSGSDEDELTTEEENSNLTNNPENFVLGVPMANSEAASAAAAAATEEGADDNDDGNGSGGGDNRDAAGDNRDAAGEESSYNGIQLVEDNWIPLISGRYFTNSHNQHHHHHHHHHQRLLGEAQQSKQRHKQKELQSASKHHHQQQQQQQLTRRAQRNMRQQRTRSANATHHDRGKRSRIALYAASTATSSATSSMAGAGDIHLLGWTLLVAISVVMMVGRPCC